MNLDVITIVSQSTPRSFVNECRRSVAAAIGAAASRDIKHIESPGVPGHIGRAMRDSVAKSTAEYVAWVDDDDFVLPNAFECLWRHLSGLPGAVCAREIHLLANGRLYAHADRHHLTAYHRDVASAVPLADYAAFPNVAVMRAAERDGRIVDEFSWVYVRRIRRSAAMALRAQASAAEREALS